jgi:hypothetical protein
MRLAKDFDPGIGLPLILYTAAFGLAFSSLTIASTLVFTLLFY